MLPILLMTLSARAEPPTWSLRVDPLTVALGLPHLQIDRVLSERWSLYLGPSARLFDGILTEGHEPFRGYGLEAGLRYFLQPSAPEGPWLMGRQVAAWLRTTEGPAAAEPGGYSSALIGYTAVLADRLVLSGGAGLNYLYYDIEGMGFSGLAPAADTAVGIAF